ncbi:MAG: hypothetical protein K2X82_26915, partial [Gemmataceae bacterium]|nr:hypothetical protein [Gemmataceae bacterium]
AADNARVLSAPARVAVLWALAGAGRPLRAPEVAEAAGGLNPGTAINALRIVGFYGLVESYPRVGGLGRLYGLTAKGRRLAETARGLAS